MLREISLEKKDKYCMIDLIYMWNLKKCPQKHSRLVVARGEGGGGGRNE